MKDFLSMHKTSLLLLAAGLFLHVAAVGRFRDIRSTASRLSSLESSGKMASSPAWKAGDKSAGPREMETFLQEKGKVFSLRREEGGFNVSVSGADAEFVHDLLKFISSAAVHPERLDLSYSREEGLLKAMILEPSSLQRPGFGPKGKDL